MKEGRWPLHRRQVGLRRVWRSVLCCCGHQDENLDMEALIVVPVSRTLLITDSLCVHLRFVLLCVLMVLDT